MTLHCTLVCGPDAGSPGPPLELTIEAPPGCAGSELEHALEAEYGAGEFSVSGFPLSSLVLGVPPLVSGAVIVVGAGGPSSRIGAEESANLLVAVHSGPAAGTLMPLRRGTYRIGRSGVEIALPDPALSREHARLEVTDTAVIITDLRSANGSFVGGKRVAQAAVSTDSVIGCGSSTLSVVFGPAPAARSPEWDTAGARVTDPIRIPHRPEGGNRSLVLATAVLPLLIGVGLAVITGMWMFLAFTAVSAISMLVPVFTGRRQRRRLKSLVAAALHEDRERRRRSAPSAAELVLRGQAPQAGRPAAPAVPDAIGLRLGLADQLANLRLDPDDPDFEAPAVGLMPFVLQLTDHTFVRGPRQDVAGLIRFIIMQLTSYRSAARIRVLVHGSPCTLPLAARYLEQVILSSNRGTTSALLERGIDRARERGLLILTGNVDFPAEGPGLSEAAVSRGWQVLDCTPAGAPESGDVIELGGANSRVRINDSPTDFLADAVPEGVFDRYCRSMALQFESSPQAEAALPQNCLLADILPWSSADVSARWLTGDMRPGLPVPIGMDTQGPRMLDLEADGPHLLVAGTTGSGKSELLRSLAAGLALSYPPTRINFLFFDFKGGSGLGPLSGLPHCVGMLTDLTRKELERALTSLRAEIRFREEALSAATAPDLSAYRAAGSPAGPLAHLVLIIDEFRMLVEDAPEALKELMRIAAIGRSLGLHLIMATQRPQGALTADIRANVTTSIALRVQSEVESVDIINTRLAAGIGLGSPGRAYLARGTENPVEFQAASLAGDGTVNSSKVQVRLAAEATGMSAADQSGQDAGQQPSPAQVAGPLVDALVNLWAAMGGGAPRHPVAPPLPSRLVYTRTAAVGGPKSGVWPVELGLVDEPERQRVSPLTWQPSVHGHLAFIGTAGSGVDEAMDLALQQLVGHDVESHIYLLDAGNSWSTIKFQPRVGASAGLHELRRAVRILERIAHEISLRLNRPPGLIPPPIVLVLGGLGSWVSSLRAGPLAWAEDLVQDIVRDGSKAGVTVVLGGDREVVTARYFASVPNRAYFPTGSTEEGRFAWPRLPDVTRLRGRSVVFGPLTAGQGSVAQFYAPPPAGAADEALVKEPVVRPFRVEALPTCVGVSDVLECVARHPAPPAGRAVAAPGVNKYRRIIVGLGGDELIPATVRLLTGGVLLVLGRPSSGKSSLLATIPLLNPEGPGWLFPGPEDDAARYWSEVEAKAEAGRLDMDSILLVDDADMLSPEAGRHVAALHERGLTEVLTAGFSASLGQRLPLAAEARVQGTGILIAPRNMMDGDLFGVRFEVEANPPPGRAVLIAEGRGTPVQLAAVPEPLGTAEEVTAPGAPRLHARRN